MHDGKKKTAPCERAISDPQNSFVSDYKGKVSEGCESFILGWTRAEGAQCLPHHTCKRRSGRMLTFVYCAWTMVPVASVAMATPGLCSEVIRDLESRGLGTG